MKAAEVFTRLDHQLRPDPARTVIRPFEFAYPPAFASGRPSRLQMVVSRVRALDTSRVFVTALTLRWSHRNHGFSCRMRAITEQVERIVPVIGHA